MTKSFVPFDSPCTASTKKKNKKKKSKLAQNDDMVWPSRKSEEIWMSRNNAEERLKIREFWLHLGEEERRSLVKVEKEAVLKKMKEQQKHNCNCSVCGKKRTAIEEELEVLYDAYYEELEQYANHQQRTRIYGGSTALSGYQQPDMYDFDPDQLEDEDYEEAYEDEEYEDEEEEEEEEEGDDEDDEDEENEEDEDEDDDDDDDDERSEVASDVDQSSYEDDSRTQLAKRSTFNNGDKFGFGNSLTVRGGILTVADDLLKNDGKKFLDMMERLAERRMQQEEKAGMEQQEGYYEEEEEEEDDEDGDYEVEGEDAKTEEEKMEEGRHMFQIFAARMFEQRVLTAYREKVAQERQLCLLREEEEEQRQREERERKKQVERERKREQRRQLKQQQEAERLAKEAERKKEEAIAKAEAERILAEERRRREQERIRKEEERRQKEEARLRREEERRRRLKEEREKAAAERERKRKEKEEQDKRDLAEKKVRDQAERKRRALAEKARREAVAARKELEQREAREQEEEERLKSQNEIECLLNKAFDLPALAPTAICNSSSPALFNIGDETRHQVLMDTLVGSSSSLTQRGPMFGDYSLPAVSSRPVPNSLLFPVGHGVGIVGIDNSNPTPVFGVPMPLGYSSSRLLSSPKSSITPITTTTATTTTTTTTTTTPTQISRHHPHPQITPIGQMPNGRRASSASTVGTVGTVGSPVIQRPPSQEAMMRPSSSTRAPTIKKRSAVLPDTPEDTHSLFSNFLFGEPSSRGNTSTLTMQPERTTRGQWIQDHMPLDRRFSNDSGLVWTNGWTASSVLSDNVHGKLFGDALPDRNAHTLERAWAAYQKLEEIIPTKYYAGPSSLYTLTQLHLMICDLYVDYQIEVRELYEAIHSSPQSGFQCFNHPQHGIVVLYEPSRRASLKSPYSSSIPPLSPRSLPHQRAFSPLGD